MDDRNSRVINSIVKDMNESYELNSVPNICTHDLMIMRWRDWKSDYTPLHIVLIFSRASY